MENLEGEVPEHVQLSMHNKKFTIRTLKEMKQGTIFPFMRLFPGIFKTKNRKSLFGVTWCLGLAACTVRAVLIALDVGYGLVMLMFE